MMVWLLLFSLLLFAYAAFEEANLASYEDCFSQCTVQDAVETCARLCRLLGFQPRNSP